MCETHNQRKALPADQDVCGNVTFTDSIRLINKIINPHNSLEDRLKTYETWPFWAKQSPEKLATAGFSYKGDGDATVCFRCLGLLSNWEENDDPWEQHALWYPDCPFVLETKGIHFIKEVQTSVKREIPKDWIKNLKIQDKTEEVDDDKLCIVCCSSPKEVILVPCGHDWTCVRCIRNLDDKKCPVCREQIVQIKTL